MVTLILSDVNFSGLILKEYNKKRDREETSSKSVVGTEPGKSGCS